MFFVSVLVPWASAAQKSRIELTDGSILEGEVVSLSGGEYRISVPDIGIVKVADSQVRVMHNVGPITRPAGKKAVSSGDVAVPGKFSEAQPAGAVKTGGAIFDAVTVQNEIQKIQPAIMGNPEVMSALPGLVASPDFQALLKDPEILNAVKSMNIQALITNEKFLKMAGNPTVQDIAQKIKEKKD